MQALEMRTPIKKGMGRISMTIYMKPYDCGGGKCIYCFTDENMPKSALCHEDTLRAEKLNWDPYNQVCENFKKFSLKHNDGLKISINIMGGSFTNYPIDYQRSFIKGIYDAINQKKSDSLIQAMVNQKNAKDKLVYLMIQALPNHINDQVCLSLLKYGITEVQIGVQSINNHILQINNRPHNVQDVINATSFLKSYGFRVTYHLMIGMVGAENLHREIIDTLKAISLPEFSPDYFKLFPCVAVYSSKHNLPVDCWFKLKWNPLTDSDFSYAARKIMYNLPKFVGIGRIQRIVPSNRIMYGPTKILSPQDFQDRSNCIWLRSIMYRTIPSYDISNLQIKVVKQGAKGHFYFAEIDKVIYGFARVEEIDSKQIIIRELTVTGEPVNIGQKNDLSHNSAQHLGVGTQLVIHIMKAYSNKDIIVNPPVGVYDYFTRKIFQEQNNKLIVNFNVSETTEILCEEEISQ